MKMTDFSFWTGGGRWSEGRGGWWAGGGGGVEVIEGGYDVSRDRN